MDSNNELKPKFLSDEPLAADKAQEIRFGHPSIAENLKNTIMTCPTPFSIGLFGKWGTGKTTIVNVLKDKLKGNEIAVVSFDIWKYDCDSLRRTFLKETFRQLKDSKSFTESYEIDERLDTSITTTTHGVFHIDRSRLKFLVLLVISLIIIGTILLVWWPQHFGIYLAIFGGGLASTFFVNQLQESLISQTVTATTDKFQDPYEFEKEFEKIVSKVKSDRLLIIIDNLDRASRDKAVEMLTAIKTFLEHQKCVFLIACDPDAIRKHLKGFYSPDEPEDDKTLFCSDEFLRKFFNVYLQIPEFIDTELQSYTEYLLQETCIPNLNTSEIAYVIVSAFRENPRQIKQFINTLSSYYLLAQIRESRAKPLIVPGTITNHAVQLAKFLVIKQKAPDDYQNVINNEQSTDEQLSIFMRATKLITIENIRPFLYLKKSDLEIEIPEIDELIISLVNNKEEQVEKYIEHLYSNPVSFKALNKHIPLLLDGYRGNRLGLNNILVSILEATDKKKIELQPFIYGKAANIIATEISGELSNFEPRIIFDTIFKNCDTGDINQIISLYINILTNFSKDSGKIEYVKTVIKQFIEHQDYLIPHREQVRSLISGNFSNYDFLSLFIDNPSAQKDFISAQALRNCITDVTLDDIDRDTIRNKLNLLINFQDIIQIGEVELLLSRFGQIIVEEQSKPHTAKREDFLKLVYDIVNIFSSKCVNISTDRINSLADAV